MRYYYDIDHDKVIFSCDLEKEFYFLRKNGETEIETFNQYINECTSKNGSLIYLSHVRQYPFALKFKAYKAIKKHIIEDLHTCGSSFTEMLYNAFDGKTSDLPDNVVYSIFHSNN